MSIVQEKMYMDVDDVCAILGVSKAYFCFRRYSHEKWKNYPTVRAPEPGRWVTGREQLHIQPRVNM